MVIEILQMKWLQLFEINFLFVKIFCQKAYCKRIAFKSYFFNIFSFYKKAGGYILRTTPLKNIKSTILIRPTSPCVKKIKELQKVEIDTQNLFEIYTDNPQTLEQDLPQDFLPR